MNMETTSTKPQEKDEEADKIAKLNANLKQHNFVPALVLQCVAIYGAIINQPLLTGVGCALVLYIVWIKPQM